MDCEKQERKGEESRFIRFSNLVHQAGCIPSNRVRQIYRGIMQIMRLPAAIIVFSGSRVEETGVALAKKLIEKLMLVLFARATFTRLDRPPNGASLGDGLTLALYTLAGKTSPAHPL